MTFFLLNSYFYFLTKFFIKSTYYVQVFLFFFFKVIIFTLKQIQESLIKQFLFLIKYYHRNDLIWVDGFLLDFLQKKSIDLWLRKFVIYNGFIFSERLVFDYVVRVYLDNLLWPLHHVSILESSNVLEMLSSIIFFYFLLFTLLALFVLFIF